MIIARCTMRDRCHQNDRQHIIGYIITAIHVRCNGRANVQGRGQLYNPQSLASSRNFLYRLKTTCVAICSENTRHCIINKNYPVTPLGIFFFYVYCLSPILSFFTHFS